MPFFRKIKRCLQHSVVSNTYWFAAYIGRDLDYLYERGLHKTGSARVNDSRLIRD